MSESNIAVRVRELRKLYSLTQAEMAEVLGVTGAAISAIEHGKRLPSETLLRAICKEFQVTPGWLAGEEEPKNINKIISRLKDSDVSLRDLEIIEMYLSLPEDERSVLRKLIRTDF